MKFQLKILQRDEFILRSANPGVLAQSKSTFQADRSISRSLQLGL